MKNLIIVFMIVLSSFSILGQELQLKKASPFTAVKWENDEPIVKFKGEWYFFEKLDIFNKAQLLDFCKKEFGSKWKKRFSEDLVEVLRNMNYSPNKEVDLELSKDGVTHKYIGIFTLENRQRCVLYNNNSSKSGTSTNIDRKYISRNEAIHDLKQFKEILDTKSSYAQLSPFDYESAINKVVTSILQKDKGDISIDKLVYEMSTIIAEIGDRHSSIKNEALDKNSYKTYNLRLPFGITILDKEFIAVKQKSDNNCYIYYDDEFPYIKSINGITIKTLIDTYNFRDKKAPKQAKLSRGANAIQKYGALLFHTDKECPERVEVVFSNGRLEKKEILELTMARKGYISSLSIANYNTIKRVTKGEFNGLKKILNKNIGYIKLPMMFHYKNNNDLEQFIEKTIQEFSNTKALILDLRNNPGGSRELLQTLAPYMILPNQSPWIANVGYLRTNNPIDTDIRSMSNRYLYIYNSQNFSDNDRKAIDIFNKTCKTEKNFDHSKFSSPFYMVLRAGKISYNQPIYILVNEYSFSAASVFTAAFKGLPNIKIVGETTDGSSGNSKKIYLNNSNIRVKISTMLSFQRNGKTLDGHGTVPGIYISVDKEQIFTGKDTQLEKLVAIINDRK
ncbi:S41 family peptidase [uncultured Aquimarina sp.]|uniref:S41 family peptidase n=1 Tax=uncultured Aquimarina sp. TaxID=575652 RepID=UPI0026148212|nr:S41 family peptidase [uncultured Aquimarina sp.]